MPAIPGTEPRNTAKILSEETTNRLVSLVLGQQLGVSEALRRMASGSDGGPPEQVGRTAADRILRDERRRIAEGASVGDAAARILRLLSLELSALEREPGPRDLDRLHKLAQTLSSVERLRPKTGETREHGLLSLQEEDTQPQNGQP
jgi:hypothetical protein